MPACAATAVPTGAARPTDAARDLIPVLVELSYWGATHDAASGAPAAFKAAYRADRPGLIAAIRAGADPSKQL